MKEEKKIKKEYTFGEKKQEYSTKKKEQVDVWISPKYLETKKKVIEMLEKLDYLDESDFWILMNETRTGKMGYTGLIISHNGCLKINDNAEEHNKFNPESVKEDKDGYGNSLTFTYVNKEQGIYEVGEVSQKNCKNDYPYAMAYKRLFDRVVLKISKLAFYGVYSDSEADEFKEKQDDTSDLKALPISEERLETIKELIKETNTDITKFLQFHKINSLEEIDISNVMKIEDSLLQKKSKVDNEKLNKVLGGKDE